MKQRHKVVFRHHRYCCPCSALEESNSFCCPLPLSHEKGPILRPIIQTHEELTWQKLSILANIKPIQGDSGFPMFHKTGSQYTEEKWVCHPRKEVWPWAKTHITRVPLFPHTSSRNCCEMVLKHKWRLRVLSSALLSFFTFSALLLWLYSLSQVSI